MPTQVSFGRYILERRLAVGGMAELMLARVAGVEGSDKKVVIKRIIPSRADDAHYVHMLADEARIAAQLTHPNVVQVYEFGEADGQVFIAMEYLVGDDLETLIGQALSLQRPVDVAIACYVIAEVAEGLHHAHIATDRKGNALNIVHRDVSPANIIVTNLGTIKIVDFGIAKYDMASTTTESGIIKGKVAYMSPEQTRGTELDRRSDVFSLGVVLYELLTMKPCFKGANLPATIDAIRRAEYVPIRKLRPDVPPAIEKLVASMLAADRDKRCRSAVEVSRTLQRYMAQVGVPSPANVKQHFANLIEPTTIVAPRVHSTIADTKVPVGAAFASPETSIDDDGSQTVITYVASLADVTAPPGAQLPGDPPLPADPTLSADVTLPPGVLMLPQEPTPLVIMSPDIMPMDSTPLELSPRQTSRHEAVPLELEPTRPPESDSLHITYGDPPATRIVSQLLLRMERLGLEGLYNRAAFWSARLRHLLSRQSVLVVTAVALLTLAAGLGAALVVRWSASSQAVTTVVPVDPTNYAVHVAAPAGRLKIDSMPMGATVTLNGQAQAGVTPLVVEGIPLGVTQSVMLALKGFRPVNHEVVLEPGDGGRMVFLVSLPPESSSIEPTATPKPVAAEVPGELEPGMLVLDSEPATEVRIGKHSLGRTPLRGTKLPPGDYAVELCDVDYSKTVQVTIRAGKTTNSRIVLEKGKLLIDVRPWADVYLRNRKLGTTPMPPVELWEGDYKLRIVNKEKGVDKTLSVLIQRGKTTRVVEKL